MATVKFDAGVARRLVDLLAHDDDFRARFVSDPIAALERDGLRPTEGYESARASARCFLVSSLASKEAIFAAREEIDRMLTQGIGQITPALDAGLPPERRLRSAA